MPSLRQRLGRKRNKTPKKAKSTGDLDNATSDSNFEMSKDYVSQISDIGASNEGVNSEETTSVVSSTTDSQVTKKKRFSFKKIRRSFSRKKTPTTTNPATDEERKTSLVETDSGAVVLVQEVVRENDKGDLKSNDRDSAGVRRTQSCHVHESFTNSSYDNDAKANGKQATPKTADPEKRVDEWRMSGLLDTVERSNSVHSGSSRSNLAVTSGDNENLIKQTDEITDEVATSTPKERHTSVPVISFDLVIDTPSKEQEDGNSSPSDSTMTDGKSPALEDDPSKVESECNGITVTKNGPNAADKQSNIPQQSLPNSDEDTFCETHNLDYEYSSQDSKVEESAKGKQNTLPSNTDSSNSKNDKIPFTGVTEFQLNVKFQKETLYDENGEICDSGNEKKAVVRALDDVIRSGEMKINQDILNNEWLVLNLAKDDWVIVDYNQTNGEIIEIFDRAVEAM